jgi:1,2-dihydroxy-3-keto-5-methylthiopentene dioxygenase
MATLTFRDEDRVLRDPDEIRAALAPHGIEYRHLPARPTVAAGAPQEEVLAAYRDFLDARMAEGGWQSADVVDIHPDVPGLDAMLAKFDREHWHDEDEIRLIVDGRGLFHVNPGQGGVVCIEVEAGDWIRVPQGTLHWFHVCEARRCRAIRVFQDASGWTPHYTGSEVDRGYPPVWNGRSGA